MNRTIDAANITASQAEVVRLVYLAKLEFSSSTVYLNNTAITISYGGNDYLGIGALGSISSIGEGAELKSYNIELTLTGIDPSYIAEALGTGYKNRIATIYLALLDVNHQLIGDPTVAFRGRMDTMYISLDKESAITLSVENELNDWERPRIRRYTQEDQQLFYPGDKAFEFVNQMVEKSILWGRA